MADIATRRSRDNPLFMRTHDVKRGRDEVSRVFFLNTRGYKPETLFLHDENGGFYDFSRLDTLWTDVAGTLPAGVGDQVARVDDLSGNDNNLFQATAINRPTLRNEGSSYWLEFDPVVLPQWMACNRLINGDFYSIVAARRDDETGINVIWSQAIAPTGGDQLELRIASTQPTYTTGNGVGIDDLFATAVPTNDDMVIEAQREGLDKAILSNFPGIPGTQTPTAIVEVDSLLQLGANSLALEGWDGRMYGFLLIRRVVSNIERRLVRGFMTDLLPAFTPLDLFQSGEEGGWWDPSDLSTVWQDDLRTIPGAVDAVVGAIDDKSGNGNHLLQATAARKPILRQSGLVYYLEFDGTDDFLQVLFPTTNPVSRVSAIRQNTWILSERIFGGGDIAAGVLFQSSSTPDLQLFDGLIALSSSAAVLGSDVVVFEEHNGAFSLLSINREADSTGNPGSSTPGGITFAANLTGVLFNSDTFIYNTIMIDRVLTAQERADTEDFCAVKAGVTLP